MMRTLIGKELRQHWLVVLAVMGLTSLGLLVMAVTANLQGEFGSTFEVLKQFLLSFHLLAALVVCNRLVVTEYQSKTQLFLEGLPLSRASMIGTKYVLGFGVILAIVLVAFGWTAVLDARVDSLATPLQGMVAVRAIIFSWCLYTFFFLMGLCGRYRLPIYMFVIMGAAAIETLTAVELSRVGPIALLNDRFAYERHSWPTRELIVTSCIATTMLLLIMLLALVREGSVATLLAERMSHREKVLFTVLLIGFGFAVGLLDERAEKQPFDLPDARSFERGGVVIKAAIGAENDAGQASRIASLVADQTSALQTFLGNERMPPIFLVQRRDLDAHCYELGELEGAEGMLVRANFLSEQWHDGRFLAWYTRELLQRITEGRVTYEPNRWVLDGFAWYWLTRDAESPWIDRELLELRAAYGHQLGFSTADAEQWLTFRERVGDEIASAVAWQGLNTVHATRGPQACDAFLRKILDANISADLRGAWHVWTHPIARLYEKQVGQEYDLFLSQWRETLDKSYQRHQQLLAQVPRLQADLTCQSSSKATRIARFNLSATPTVKRFSILYCPLPPFNDEVPVEEWMRQELDYERERLGELPGTFARGTRLYWTCAVHVPELDCEVISGWVRQEMR